MINEIDLRIAFHLSTGDWPAWHPESTPAKPKTETFRGKLRSIYSRWVEDLLGNSSHLRMAYKLDTGNDSVIEGKRGLYYFPSYIEWLEERAIQNLNVIKEIKSILNFK